MMTVLADTVHHKYEALVVHFHPIPDALKPVLHKYEALTKHIKQKLIHSSNLSLIILLKNFNNTYNNVVSCAKGICKGTWCTGCIRSCINAAKKLIEKAF